MTNTKYNFYKGSGWVYRGEIDPGGYHENAVMGFGDDTKYICPFCDGDGILDSLLELKQIIKELKNENHKLFDENLELKNEVKSLRLEIKKLEGKQK